MHCIDRSELLDTVDQVRREATALMGTTPSSEEVLCRLQRMVVLLSYMAEHLEMVDVGPDMPQLSP
jgi:hypothetical protein